MGILIRTSFFVLLVYSPAWPRPAPKKNTHNLQKNALHVRVDFGDQKTTKTRAKTVNKCVRHRHDFSFVFVTPPGSTFGGRTSKHICASQACPEISQRGGMTDQQNERDHRK
jgi:hypothetical protein